MIDASKKVLQINKFYDIVNDTWKHRWADTHNIFVGVQLKDESGQLLRSKH